MKNVTRITASLAFASDSLFWCEEKKGGGRNLCPF
jgi:hypothetical protein